MIWCVVKESIKRFWDAVLGPMLAMLLIVALLYLTCKGGELLLMWLRATYPMAMLIITGVAALVVTIFAIAATVRGFCAVVRYCRFKRSFDKRYAAKGCWENIPIMSAAFEPYEPMERE